MSCPSVHSCLLVSAVLAGLMIDASAQAATPEGAEVLSISAKAFSGHRHVRTVAFPSAVDRLVVRARRRCGVDVTLKVTVDRRVVILRHLRGRSWYRLSVAY